MLGSGTPPSREVNTYYITITITITITIIIIITITPPSGSAPRGRAGL